MAKFIYCSNCGTKLEIKRKALKNFGRIIDLVDPHTCTEEPQELDLTLTPVDLPAGDEKFVQKLNELKPSLGVSTMDLKDRRKAEFVKSTAPASILQNIKSQTNTVPERELGDPISEGDE